MKRITTWALASLLLVLTGLVLSGNSQAHDTQTPGSMGPGMAPGYGQGYHHGYGMVPGSGYHMGPGMMGHGHHMAPGQSMGPHMMGPGYGMMPGYGMRSALPKDLSSDEVRHMLGHRLALQDNPNIKLGKVEEKDADTIVAEIVTKDGSLVDRFEVDRHTGQMRRPK